MTLTHSPHNLHISKIMVASGTNPSTFPLFASLPRELRDQIWRDALPDKVGPALSFYYEGCWLTRRLSEFDDAYDPKVDDDNSLVFEFQHDLLDDIRFEIPLLYVNREARDFAFAWIREQVIEVRPTGQRLGPLFVRPFDPMHDALYIPLDKWDDFLRFREPNDRPPQPELVDRLLFTKSDLTCIAVPIALLRSDVTPLSEIFEHLFHLELLLIILDPQPNTHSADDDLEVRHRWDFESTLGGPFLWNEGLKRFDSEISEYAGEETLYRLIEEASRGLSEWLPYWQIQSFELRPVVAVRR